MCTQCYKSYLCKIYTTKKIVNTVTKQVYEKPSNEIKKNRFVRSKMYIATEKTYL